VGDSLFVRLDGSRVTVLSVKRDAWLVGLAGLFACTLFYFYRGRGFLILLSVAVNVGLMAFVLVRGSTDAFFAWQWPILIAAFCVGTLLLVGGFRRQTLGTISLHAFDGAVGGAALSADGEPQQRDSLRHDGGHPGLRAH
jgi:uncharacterized membrane protein